MRSAVSVVIPSYNTAAYLPDAIDSALNQTVAPLEVIVVNDGSTDETAQALDRYPGRIVSISQENRGLSAARNRGIGAARGDLIAFLDADDVWLPNKLEKQLRSLSEHPGAGMVHTETFYWTPQTGEKYVPDDGGRKVVGRCYEGFLFRCGIAVSSVVVRRECLDRIGTFDEQIRRPTTQDYDLWFRIGRHHEIAHVPEPLTIYRLHSSNVSKQTLAMSEDILYVVRKALKADPALGRMVGRKAVDDRLFDLLFDIGYHHHDAGRTLVARSYLRQALYHRPMSARTWSLYLANFLPPGWVRGLRRWKSPLAVLGPSRS